MRKLTIDEQRKYFTTKAELESKIQLAISKDNSKSAIKKLKAQNHNDWQTYLKNNKIVALFSFLYTESKDPIESLPTKID